MAYRKGALAEVEVAQMREALMAWQQNVRPGLIGQGHVINASILERAEEMIDEIERLRLKLAEHRIQFHD